MVLACNGFPELCNRGVDQGHSLRLARLALDG